MKKMLLVFLIASLAANAYLIIQISGSKATVEPNLTSHAEVDDAAYLDRIVELEEENQRLSEQLAQLTKQQQFAQLPENAIAEQRPVSEATQESVSDAGMSFYEEYKAKKKSIRERFVDEPQNVSWATEAELQVVKLITESEFVSDFSLNNVSCKTTMCKIVVTPYKNNDGAKVGAMMNISSLLIDVEQFKGYHSVSHDLDENEQLEIIFYPAEG